MLKIKELDQISILRKFTLFFFVVSIVPLLVLFYLYLEMKRTGNITLHSTDLQNTIFIVGIGIACGYWILRKIILNIIVLSKTSQEALLPFIPSQASISQKGETNEILTLTKTFAEIKNKLEQDVIQLKSTQKTLHDVLTKMSEGLGSINETENFLQLMLETITGALLGKTGVIFLVDKDANQLNLKTITGDSSFALKEIKSDHFLFSSIVNSKTAVTIPHLPEGTKDLPQNRTIEFPIICAPLLAENQVFGLIAVCGRKTPEKFQADELTLTYTVAVQIAAAIHNKELKYLASIDPLTKIFNYRHMIEMLDYEINRSKRYPGTLCFLMIDIDNFKSYNDSFGHPVGDQVLIETAKAIKNQLRITDTFCRYGGDEFAIILPQTDFNGASKVAKKILTAVDSIFVEKKITVSIGITQWMFSMKRQDIIAKADHALYEAKKAGKNQIAFNS